MDDERSRLEALLRTLGDEERSLSAQRSKLHERLSVFPDPALEQRERELSRKRRELHERIDEIRAQLGLEPWRSGEGAPTSAGLDVQF